MRTDAPALADLQRAMVQAVHADARAFGATVETIDDAGIDARKRLFLHVNTINHALVAVLRQAYPATARRLGDDRFDGAAKDFVHAHPPARPVLSAYGAGFADVLIAGGALSGSCEALSRLDWAAHTAYFAADAPALDGAALAAVPEDDRAGLRLSPVPSVRLVAVAHADAWARWCALTDPTTTVVAGPAGNGIADSSAGNGIAAGLIWRRPDQHIAAHGVGAPEQAFLDALFAGATLVDAAERAGGPDGFDLSSLLSTCLAGGVFRRLGTH